MERKIIDFIKDEEGHWTAILACGHKQHVRHNPPWQIRPWTQTQKGRNKFMTSTKQAGSILPFSLRHGMITLADNPGFSAPRNGRATT